MGKEHRYGVTAKWTGDRGVGTRGYRPSFIVRSVNFPVKTEPEFLVATPPASGVGTDDVQPEDADMRRSREG